MKKICCLLLAVVICLGVSSTALALGTCNDEHFILLGWGYCNANNVNIRTGPGKSYASVGQANNGDGFLFYETVGEAHNGVNRDGAWTHVHGNHIGWIYSQYFTVSDAAQSPVELERA